MANDGFFPVHLHVLIVEDTPDDAELIAFLLRRGGFQFEWVRVETEIEYNAALQTHYDLILSDWSLPQFSGLRALQLLQERGLDTPFIIVSGSIGEESAVAAMRQGAYDYLLKDRLDRLGQAVQNALEQKKLREERTLAQEALEKRIIALTRPLDLTDSLEFEELFNLDDIQKMQDKFARATGVASIITHPDGKPITQPSNFCHLCREIIRQTELGKINCFQSDAMIGRYHPEGPIIQPCLSGGLWDAGASISVGGQHIANWLIGQVRDETQTDERLLAYAREIGTDEGQFLEAFHKVPPMAKERFEDVANALFTIAGQLSSMAYQNVQQARFISEQKQAADLKNASLRLHEVAANDSLTDLLQGTIAEAEILTRSRISRYICLEPDQITISMEACSNRTLLEFSVPEDARQNSFMEETGGWENCIQDRSPVMRNNIQKSPNDIKMPEGYSGIIRELIVPVFRAGKIVAILGVGNKESDYNDNDLQIVSHLADLAWDIVEKTRVENDLRQSEERFSKAFHTNPDGIFILRLSDGVFIDANKSTQEMIGYGIDELIGKSIEKLNVFCEIGEYEEIKRNMGENQSVNNYEAWIRAKSGEKLNVLISIEPITLNRDPCLLFIFQNITDRKRAEETLLKLSEELIIAYDATLQGWSNALEMRERETAGHSQRVVQLTLDMANTLGIKEEDIIHIQRGALLHDIGKMGIPDNILLKPGPLSDDEWVIMRQHPIYAYRLLSKIPYLLPTLDIPYCHHEKWDGSGYPRKLKGEEIPMAARIFAIVDVWDALLYDRPYRPAWPEESVIQYIQEQRGKHFDPKVVDAFLSLIMKNHYK